MLDIVLAQAAHRYTQRRLGRMLLMLGIALVGWLLLKETPNIEAKTPNIETKH